MKGFSPSRARGGAGPGRFLRLSLLKRIDVMPFVRHLRHRTRMSAIRGALDGLVVWWIIKRRGIRPLIAELTTKPAREDPETAVQVAAAVDAGLGLLPTAPTCLRRSMTLIRELNRLSLAATVHIGVRTVAEEVEAHAWVQVGDAVVNDDPRLTRTYSELVSAELESLLPLFK